MSSTNTGTKRLRKPKTDAKVARFLCNWQIICVIKRYEIKIIRLYSASMRNVLPNNIVYVLKTRKEMEYAESVNVSYHVTSSTYGYPSLCIVHVLSDIKIKQEVTLRGFSLCSEA